MPQASRGSQCLLRVALAASLRRFEGIPAGKGELRLVDCDNDLPSRVDGLPGMEPVEVAARSNTKEAQAWRAFSARLARRLEEAAPGALETIWTPYGGMTAAQWLAVREERGL